MLIIVVMLIVKQVALSQSFGETNFVVLFLSDTRN